MAGIEVRGDSVRVAWRLGGRRTGAKQSATFSGGTAEGRLKLADAADNVLKARGHDMTRAELYEAILGRDDSRADDPMPTFTAWLEEWAANRAALRDIQPDVLRNYVSTLRARAVPWLGHLRLDQIDEAVLRSWVGWMSASRVTLGSKNRRDGDRLLSPRMIRYTYIVLHGCLGAAVPRWLTVNPAARRNGARKHTVGLPTELPFEAVFLSKDEADKILAQCLPLVRDMVYVALRTGLRLGELIALEHRHVVFNPRGATIMVRQAVKNDGSIGPPKSAASIRDVPVHPKVAALLRARLEGKRPSSPVFATASGKRWNKNNFRARFWLRAVAAAQRCAEHPPPLPPLSPQSKNGQRRQWRVDEVSTCGCEARLHRRPRFHDLRHSHASSLIHKGWHAKKIQRRLGHASYLTTMNIYGHLIDLGDEGQLDGVEDYWETPAPPVRGRHAATRSAARRSRRAVVRHRVVLPAAAGSVCVAGPR